MKRLFLLTITAILFLSACSAPKGITVREARMRPTAAGENGAVDFVLQND